MSTDRPKRESLSLEEATVSNMWEIAAIVELLEQKGLRQEIPRRVIRTESQRPACYMLYGTRVSAALHVCFRPNTVIRGVDLRSIEDTAVIELLLTRPERKVER